MKESDIGKINGGESIQMAESAINGLNSNLDTAGIVEKLVALNRRPAEITLAKREIEIEKLNAFQDLKSRLLTFKSSLTGLNKEDRFLSVAGEFANNSPTDINDVMEVSTNSTAVSGKFSTTVTQLAREGKVVSGGVSTIADAIPQGTFELMVGGIRTMLDINSTNNTLDGLRLAINNSGANVKASFINDGNNIRLVIAGTETGSENPVSARLFQTIIGSGPVTAFSFTEAQRAQDAIVTVDGVNVTKSSNTITDAIQGTTISLFNTGSGTLTLQSDTQTIQDKVSSFVESYNELMQFLNDQLFLDADTNLTGSLFGNFTAQNLQQTLRNSVSNKIIGLSGNYNYLSQVGIRTDETGFLSVNEQVLTDAINKDTDSVAELFASKGSTNNSQVTFIGFTDETEPGTYDVQVSGGIPQLSKKGENSFANATGSGSFYAGAQDTYAEGLNFRIGSLSNQSLGQITLSLGVAEIINRKIGNLTDTSRQGPLVSEMDTITETIEDFDNTLDEQEERLALFEQNMKDRFTNLEVVLGRLNSQKEAFSSALSGIQEAFKPRK